jgi:hypothetical protein
LILCVLDLPVGLFTFLRGCGHFCLLWNDKVRAYVIRNCNEWEGKVILRVYFLRIKNTRNPREEDVTLFWWWFYYSRINIFSMYVYFHRIKKGESLRVFCCAFICNCVNKGQGQGYI